MCKLNNLKQALFGIRATLKRYDTIIPGSHKSKYEKDIAMIFKDLDNSDEESYLIKMSKMAKTKLKSVERIYGAIREEDKSEAKIKPFLDDSVIKMFKDKLGVDIDPNKPYKSKIEELKNSPGFNPELVKKYQEGYKEYKDMVQQAYYTAMDLNKKEKEKKENIIDDIMAQGSPLDLSSSRDDEGNVDKEKVKQAIREIMIQNRFENVEERIAEMDIDEFLGEMKDQDNPEVRRNKEIINEMKRNIHVDSKASRELFEPLDSQKRVSEEEVDEFMKKVKPILQDQNLTEDQKKELYLKELDKAETEWTKNNLDGYITYGPYGDIQVHIFKDVEEGEERPKDEKEQISKNEEKNSTGVKNYVWRDGKLVEGKAKERKVVTYSNWTTGHLNPDDMRKHRELLDRQHFGGPLWEGIKYVGNLTKAKGKVHIHPPTAEDLELMEKNKIDIPKTEGKKEFVEIVR